MKNKRVTYNKMRQGLVLEVSGDIYVSLIDDPDFSSINAFNDMTYSELTSIHSNYTEIPILGKLKDIALSINKGSIKKSKSGEIFVTITLFANAIKAYSYYTDILFKIEGSNNLFRLYAPEIKENKYISGPLKDNRLVITSDGPYAGMYAEFDQEIRLERYSDVLYEITANLVFAGDFTKYKKVNTKVINLAKKSPEFRTMLIEDLSSKLLEMKDLRDSLVEKDGVTLSLGVHRPNDYIVTNYSGTGVSFTVGGASDIDLLISSLETIASNFINSKNCSSSTDF